jgi:hypothetical protein
LFIVLAELVRFGLGIEFGGGESWPDGANDLSAPQELLHHAHDHSFVFSFSFALGSRFFKAGHRNKRGFLNTSRLDLGRGVEALGEG